MICWVYSKSKKYMSHVSIDFHWSKFVFLIEWWLFQSLHSDSIRRCTFICVTYTRVAVATVMILSIRYFSCWSITNLNKNDDNQKIPWKNYAISSNLDPFCRSPYRLRFFWTCMHYTKRGTWECRAYVVDQLTSKDKFGCIFSRTKYPMDRNGFMSAENV